MNRVIINDGQIHKQHIVSALVLVFDLDGTAILNSLDGVPSIKE